MKSNVWRRLISSIDGNVTRLGLLLYIFLPPGLART